MGYCIFLRKGETHTPPSAGILASDLAVGDIVKLMEGGTAVEYIVVNQGIPENSSLYDSSCSGTWLLRKDCYNEQAWSGNNNNYSTSSINTFLNNDFFNLMGNIEQTTIKQVKIPYSIGGRDTSDNTQGGADGLSTKVFLLSAYEVGFTSSDSQYVAKDGVNLSYTDWIAYLNGSAVAWWLRSPFWNSNSNVGNVTTGGGLAGSSYSASRGVRPALILPSTAKFDETTKILKG